VSGGSGVALGVVALRGRPGRLGLGAGLNSQFTLKSNDRRRFCHPISGIWPNAAQAIGAVVSPIKLPILLDAGTGAAEHFPAVGADVGDASAFVEPKPTSFAHGLHPGINAAPFTSSGGHQNGAVCWMPVPIAQITPDQPVQLIV